MTPYELGKQAASQHAHVGRSLGASAKLLGLKRTNQQYPYRYGQRRGSQKHESPAAHPPAATTPEVPGATAA